MKQKGFTLIELLVVIGFLAGLIILIMPAILNAMEETNRKVFADQLVDFANRVQTKYDEVRHYEGANAPTCYKISKVKTGEVYGGCILIDYSVAKVGNIYVYSNMYYYDDSLNKLMTEKSKVIKPIPGGQVSSIVELFDGAGSTNCPSTCVDVVDYKSE